MNEFDQLKDLCGNRKWIGLGSVIIITTRDRGLLNILNVDYVYKMEEMNENEALELFSWEKTSGSDRKVWVVVLV